MKHTIVRKIWIEDGMRKETFEEKKTADDGEILYLEARQCEESLPCASEEAVEEIDDDERYFFECVDDDGFKPESTLHAIFRFLLERIGLVPAK